MYHEKSDEWEIKSSTLLSRAEGNIKKALELDDDYDDAQVLNIQLLVLKGSYKLASAELEKIKNYDNRRMESQEVYKEKWALYYSWKAYIAFKLKRTKTAYRKSGRTVNF